MWSSTCTQYTYVERESLLTYLGLTSQSIEIYISSVQFLFVRAISDDTLVSVTQHQRVSRGHIDKTWKKYFFSNSNFFGSIMFSIALWFLVTLGISKKSHQNPSIYGTLHRKKPTTVGVYKTLLGFTQSCRVLPRASTVLNLQERESIYTKLLSKTLLQSGYRGCRAVPTF